jgi:hypothetical protein
MKASLLNLSVLLVAALMTTTSVVELGTEHTLRRSPLDLKLALVARICEIRAKTELSVVRSDGLRAGLSISFRNVGSMAQSDPIWSISFRKVEWMARWDPFWFLSRKKHKHQPTVGTKDRANWPMIPTRLRRPQPSPDKCTFFPPWCATRSKSATNLPSATVVRSKQSKK